MKPQFRRQFRLTRERSGFGKGSRWQNVGVIIHQSLIPAWEDAVSKAAARKVRNLNAKPRTNP